MTTWRLQTLPQALAQAAEERSGAGHTFVDGDGTVRFYWSFAALHRRAREIAAALAGRGVKKGERVALVLPQAEEFVPAFLGTSLTGAVPVPLYPPMAHHRLRALAGYRDHVGYVVGASRASLVLASGAVLEAADLGSLGYAVTTCEELGADAGDFRDPSVALGDVALIQFTSGSTARPKGVVITHSNLAHNARALMREGLRVDGHDRAVSWLPLFHDMGLGLVIAPTMHLVPVTFMQPLSFMRRPARWLAVLSEHRGTITAAPNFAYGMAASEEHVKDHEIEGLDLSCVRGAACGAEPIRAETLRAFARRYAAHGFDAGALMPCYGMTESTLATTFARGLETERVRRDGLHLKGRADPTDEGPEIVDCGPVIAGHGLRIVDTRTREELPARSVGEIEIWGPSVTPGYFEEEQKTREAIDEEGWFKTGDLGYLNEAGRLFVCGRTKDIIIIHGRNYYPQDLEWAVATVPGVVDVVAFAAHEPGLDRDAVVIVAGIEDRATLVDPRLHETLRAEITHAAQSATGLVVDEVVIAQAGSVPKTSSGKVMRTKARALYEAGEIVQGDGPPSPARQTPERRTRR